MRLPVILLTKEQSVKQSQPMNGGAVPCAKPSASQSIRRLALPARNDMEECVAVADLR